VVSTADLPKIKIDRKISKFLVTPDNIKIKTDKFKGRKKNTEIKHIIDLPLVDITDTTEKDELTKIFSSKVPLNSKLNFYKP